MPEAHLTMVRETHDAFNSFACNNGTTNSISFQGRAMQHLHFPRSPSTRSRAEARKAWGLPRCCCQNSSCCYASTHSNGESPCSHPRTTRDCLVSHPEACKQPWSMALETVPDCQGGSSPRPTAIAQSLPRISKGQAHTVQQKCVSVLRHERAYGKLFYAPAAMSHTTQPGRASSTRSAHYQID
jgi:hypothetical protein